MTNLTRIAIATRKTVRYAIYLTILLIVGRIVLNLGIGIYNILFPKPPPPPTVTYGKLPKLPFPETAEPVSVKYTVQTATGELPKFANQAKVYFMPKHVTSFNATDATREKAAILGYPTQKEKVNDTVYRFVDKDQFGTIEINTVSNLFTVSYNLSADPSPLSTRPANPEVAAGSAKSLLSSAKLLPADLTGPTTNVFLKAQAQQVVPALSLSDASFVKVNLFRKDYDEFPSVTLNPDEANVWFMYGGGSKLIAAQYKYYPVDEEHSSTYPIKTAQAAVDELTGGTGFIAKKGVNNDSQTTIRKIYLAYYDSGKPQDFYQPIFVFEGDRGFIAYLPAVTAEYYGQ